MAAAAAVVSAQRLPLPSGRQSKLESRSSGRELVQRTRAIGGEAAFRSHHVREAARTVRNGRPKHFRGLRAAVGPALPDADELPTSLASATEQGSDGTNAWMIDPQTGPRLLKDREKDETMADADFDGPLHLPPTSRADDPRPRDLRRKDAFKVKVVLLSGVEQDEYFDAATGLQLGWEARRATPLGVVPTTAILRE